MYYPLTQEHLHHHLFGLLLVHQPGFHGILAYEWMRAEFLLVPKCLKGLGIPSKIILWYDLIKGVRIRGLKVQWRCKSFSACAGLVCEDFQVCKTRYDVVKTSALQMMYNWSIYRMGFNFSLLTVVLVLETQIRNIALDITRSAELLIARWRNQTVTYGNCKWMGDNSWDSRFGMLPTKILFHFP